MSNSLVDQIAQWNADAVSAEISIASQRLLDALLTDDRTSLEALVPPLRRAYEYLAASNAAEAESTPLFAHGRLATLLECLRFAIVRTEPASWKAHLRDEIDLKILRSVADQWQRVSDIAMMIGLHNTTTTKRLKKLATEELVVPHPIGREVYYRLGSAARETLHKRGFLLRSQAQEQQRQHQVPHRSEPAEAKTRQVPIQLERYRSTRAPVPEGATA